MQSDPETERYRLFDAVAAWLGAISADNPLLLVLDDLQWAAKPTLLLLRHVVSSRDPKRLLVLATYRDTELGHDHPLGDVLADLRRQRAVERLSLLGLDSSGVAAYLEQAAGHALDDEDLALARAIHEETEGNPFFVREVLRHLTETGAVAEQAGRWGVRLAIEDVGIPEGVREVVGRRLARLSPGANRLLEVAAVAGLEFEMRILQSVEGLADDELVASLEEATESRLVTEVGGPDARYRFAHALVRDTLYSGLSTARRVTLHRPSPKGSRRSMPPLSRSTSRPLPTIGPKPQPRRPRAPGPSTTPPGPATRPWPNSPTTKRCGTTGRPSNSSAWSKAPAAESAAWSS